MRTHILVPSSSGFMINEGTWKNMDVISDQPSESDGGLAHTILVLGNGMARGRMVGPVCKVPWARGLALDGWRPQVSLYRRDQCGWVLHGTWVRTLFTPAWSP